MSAHSAVRERSSLTNAILAGFNLYTTRHKASNAPVHPDDMHPEDAVAHAKTPEGQKFERDRTVLQQGKYARNTPLQRFSYP